MSFTSNVFDHLRGTCLKCLFPAPSLKDTNFLGWSPRKKTAKLPWAVRFSVRTMKSVGAGGTHTTWGKQGRVKTISSQNAISKLQSAK